MEDRERRMWEKSLQFQKQLVELNKERCSLLKEQNDILRQIAGVSPRKEDKGKRPMTDEERAELEKHILEQQQACKAFEAFDRALFGDDDLFHF